MKKLYEYNFIDQTFSRNNSSQGYLKMMREFDIDIQTIILDMQFTRSKKSYDVDIIGQIVTIPILSVMWSYYWNYYSDSDKSLYTNYRVIDSNDIDYFLNSVYCVKDNNDMNSVDVSERDFVENNKCVSCGIEMGETNPRQYCGKTHCLNDFYA